MNALRSTGLESSVHDAVRSGRPFLGICVGMQMLFDASEEDDTATGLGVSPARFAGSRPDVKRPQMQWNRLDLRLPDDPMFAGLGRRPLGLLRALVARGARRSSGRGGDV